MLKIFFDIRVFAARWVKKQIVMKCDNHAVADVLWTRSWVHVGTIYG